MKTQIKKGGYGRMKRCTSCGYMPRNFDPLDSYVSFRGGVCAKCGGEDIEKVIARPKWEEKKKGFWIFSYWERTRCLDPEVKE